MIWAFENILGQTHGLAFLERMLKGKALPKALLFHGLPQVGKRKTALALALALNCQEKPKEGCGNCPSCKKFLEHAHGDLLEVKPKTKNILLEQIRELHQRLNHRALEAKVRVVLLWDADKLLPTTANALLKLVEEPPANTLFILLAEKSLKVYETLRSRCLLCGFTPLNQEVLEKKLSPLVSSEKKKAFLLAYAQGSLCFETKESISELEELREEWLALLHPEKTKLSFQSLQAYTKKWEKKTPKLFEWVESWLHDLLLLPQVGSAYCLNKDKEEELTMWLQHYSPKKTLACYEKLTEAKLSLNLNPQALLLQQSLWQQFSHVPHA